VILCLLALLASITAPASVQKVEDVSHASATPCVSAHDRFLTSHVLEPSLFRVSQHIMGLAHRLEHLLVSATVRVVLHSQFFERLLDVSLRITFFDS